MEENDASDRIASLEKRVDVLERQIASLLKRTRTSPTRPRDYRDQYDALDYPER